MSLPLSNADLANREGPTATIGAGYSAEQISVLHMTFDAFSGRLVAASRHAGR